MSISGKTKIAGVMGWPVSHSLSPRLHGYWLKHANIDGAYIPLPVRTDQIEKAILALPALGLRGANVTIPHKETAFQMADHVTSRAQAVRAANTLVVEEDGTLTADNTDGYGFLENVRYGAPHWVIAGGTAVVLGAGGAARGVIASLLEAGIGKIIVSNRTRSRAETLVADLWDGKRGPVIQVVAWDQKATCLDQASVLINTTVLGMHGQSPLDLDLTRLPTSTVVTDIVYTPLMTDLLKRAAMRGNPVVDGLGMLVHQARPGFEAWFGVMPPVTTALRDHLLGFLVGQGK